MSLKDETCKIEGHETIFIACFECDDKRKKENKAMTRELSRFRQAAGMARRFIKNRDAIKSEVLSALDSVLEVGGGG